MPIHNDPFKNTILPCIFRHMFEIKPLQTFCKLHCFYCSTDLLLQRFYCYRVFGVYDFHFHQTADRRGITPGVKFAFVSIVIYFISKSN